MIAISRRCSVLNAPDRGRDTESGRRFCFLKLPELRDTAIAARLDPIKNLVKLRLSAAVRAAFGHFIPMMNPLGDGREDRKGAKDWSQGRGGGERKDEVGR
jgi:hypothetical protein